MINNQNNSFSCSRNTSVRLSFFEVLAEVRRWVEYECIDRRDQEAALGLCRIIAEVMILNPDREMQIGNDTIPVSIVQEIYTGLRSEHLEVVIRNFHEQTALIKNKKAYLRAALYNSAFEIDAHYTNWVKHDLGI